MSHEMAPARLTLADRTLLRAVLRGRSLSALAKETGLSEGVARGRLVAILSRVHKVAHNDEARELAAAFAAWRSEPPAQCPASPGTPPAAGVVGTATAAAGGGRLTADEIGRMVAQLLASAGLSKHRVGWVHLRGRGTAEAGVLSPSGRMALVVAVDRRTGAVLHYD